MGSGSTSRSDAHVWIQAHPSRSAIHSALIESLAPLKVELSLHDSSPPNPWAGYRQAIERFISRENSHAIVLQDDVIVCRNFPPAVMAAIEERPEHVLSLWVGALRSRTTKEFHLARKRGETWSPIYFRDIHHCVALVWPRALAEEFLEWTDLGRIPGYARDQQSDDAIIGAWARKIGHQFWATVPCLVEHVDDPETVPSTIDRPQGSRGRQAIVFAGE